MNTGDSKHIADRFRLYFLFHMLFETERLLFVLINKTVKTHGNSPYICIYIVFTDTETI